MISAVYKKLISKLQPLGISEDMLVFGDGRQDASVMLIGEAPGKDEVLQKKPFCGKAGKNLDEFLAATGIRREELFITNTVKFRPYKIGASGRKSNRPPTKNEIMICRECLLEEIRILSPKIIVTLGNTALHAVLGDDKTIGEVHGQLIGNVFALYHPASIIYRRELAPVYKKDMEKLAAIIGGMQ